VNPTAILVLKPPDLHHVAKSSLQKVVNIEVTEEKTTVYNFDVADNHNYFIGEGGVLVHNYDLSLAKFRLEILCPILGHQEHLVVHSDLKLL
jgi:hypothetical protein